MSTANTRGRRILRRLALGVSMVVALVVVAVVAALISLRSRGVRLSLLARASAVVERAAGVRLDAEDLALRLADGRLELVEPRLAVGDATPFLVARRVSVTVEITSLWRPPLHVVEVLVEQPRVDLAAVLPTMPEAEAETAVAARPLPRVDRVRLTGGGVRGGAVPDAARPWLRDWSIDGVDVGGSLVDGQLTVALESARVNLLRPEPGSGELELSGVVSGSLEGPLRVRDLAVAGDGLRVAVQGEVALAPELAFTGDVELEAEPGLLAPARGIGGEVRLGGSVSSKPIATALEISASDLALEAARPYMDEALYRRLAVAATVVDLDGRVSVNGDPERPAGSITLTWRRADEVLVRADADLVNADDSVVATFAAALLPQASGVRSISGRVAAGRAVGLADGRIEEVRANWETSDLAAEVAFLRTHWPELVPELPPQIVIGGPSALRVTASGAVADPAVAIAGSWRPGLGGMVRLEGEGRPAAPRGRLRLTLDELPVELASEGVSGTVSGEVAAAGTPDEYTVSAALDGRSLSLGDDLPSVDSAHLEITSDGASVDLESLVATLSETVVEATGRATLARPLTDVELDVAVSRPLAEVERAAARVTLAGGTVRVADGIVESRAGTAFVDLEVPLGALAALPQGDALSELPLQLDQGPIHFAAFAPDLDTCLLADVLALPEREERGFADLALDVWLDPLRPALSTAHLTLSGLEASAAGSSITTSAPLSLRAEQGTVELEPLQVAIAGTDVRLRGEAALRPDWRLDDAPSTLVESFRGELFGRIGTAVLEPYLVGVVTTGTLDFEASASGTPAEPRASLSLRGADASLAWATPYPLRVSQPVFEAGYAEGALTLWSGEMAVNRGSVTLRGTVDRSGRGELQAELDGLRLRLDYGMRASVSGETVLTLWPKERPLLSGTLVVDRGVLDRDLDLEREVLGQFMAPVVTAGTEDNPLDRIDLDLGVVTVDGVRVKNNLADLTARWDRIEVGGTAWNPLIRGTVSIDPGGLVYAYGQTVRIDRGELQFTGDPIADPSVELTTTGSWQDSTIPTPGQEASPFAAGRAEEGAQVLEAFSTGIAGYYGERVASRIGDSLGLGRVSLRPVLVFGETDPSARLTISRDVSRSVALAVSLDLRNTQRQTYVLDVRDLPKLGAFRGQVFTNDEGNAGASLQQVLELGGTRSPVPDGPVLDRVVWDAPPEVPRRVLKRALNFEKGEPLPDGAAFDLEIELEHELRRAGWPAATVAVHQGEEDADGRVELVASIVPGSRVRFEFTGDRPPRGLRSGITDLYRPGPGELATLEELRKQTVRVLRSAGYLDPEVDVSTRHPDGGDGLIVVAVHSRGGVEAELGPPRFDGVPAEVAARLAERFPGAVERAELALGVADADARALAALRDLGYPEARLTGRFMTLDRRELVVDVQPGPRRTVAGVEMDGVPGEQREELGSLVPIEVGGPLRRDLIARGAAAMEEQLRQRGYARAAVRASVETKDGDRWRSVVRYEVRPGQRYELEDVSVVGNRWTGERAVKSLAALEPGTPYRSAEVAAARGRLLRSGIYSRVVADTEYGDGTARVELQLVERARFQVAYGLRYESDVGTSAVVDLLDRNLLGRGVTAGLRVRWEPDDRSGRLFANVPEVLGWPVAVETYGERRREVRGGLIRDVSEAALQVSSQIGHFTTGRVYARYRDTKLSEVDPDPFFPFEVRLTHPYVGVQLVHDRRDDLLQPRSGALATFDLSGSGSFVGSDFSYVRGYGQVNLYRAIGRIAGRAATWAQSYRVGLAHAFDQELIPDVRFRAGGEFSLRGYPTEGVGPVDDLGGTISPAGGAAVLVVNQELRLALPWDLTGVGFVDLGGVWADIEDFGTDLVSALGFGVRASTPVGLLRVDFAVPLDRRDWEPRYKFYAGFGNAF